MAVTTGMWFTIDPTVNPAGTPIAQYFTDTGVVAGASGASAEGNAEATFPSDWSLCVTGVPSGTSAATIAASILSSPVAIPLPWGSKRWKVAYSSLGSACTASVYS